MTAAGHERCRNIAKLPTQNVGSCQGFFNIWHQKSWKRILIKYSARQSSAKQTKFVRYIFVVSGECDNQLYKIHIYFISVCSFSHNSSHLLQHMHENHLNEENLRNEYWNSCIACMPYQSAAFSIPRPIVYMLASLFFK